MTERCEQVRLRFSEYVDGELTPEERAAVDEHLAACADCREDLDALRRTVEAVASLPRHSAPPDLAGRVVAELRSPAPSVRPKLVTLVYARALPIAAMLLIVLGITFMVGYSRTPRLPTAGQKLARSLAPARPAPAAGEAPSRARAERASAAAEAFNATRFGTSAPPQMGRPAEEEKMMEAEEPAPAAAAAKAAARPSREARRRAYAAAATGAPVGMTDDRELLKSTDQGTTQPGLHGRAVGQAGRQAEAGALRESQLQATSDAVLRDGAALFAFGLPVRTISFSAQDPEATALQIVNVANANGVLVSVGLPPSAQKPPAVGRRAGGAPAPVSLAAQPKQAAAGLAAPETTLRLRVPADRYQQLMAQLAGVVPTDESISAGLPMGLAAAGARQRAAGQVGLAKEAVQAEARRSDVAAAGAPSAGPAPARGLQEGATGGEAAAEAGRPQMVELVVVIRPLAQAAVARSAAVQQPAE